MREQFSVRFSLRKKCTKDPTEITKIVRRAHESLLDFKERWTDEASYISGVPEIMRISAFMNAHRCPALAKKFSDRVPKTVTEMFIRVDDFIRSEEAFRNTELPRGEVYESNRRGNVTYHNKQGRSDQSDRPRPIHHNNRPQRSTFHPYVTPRINRTNQDRQRDEHNRNDLLRRPGYRPNLEELRKAPREILATEHHLNLPRPPPTGSQPRREHADKFCEYHRENGHLTDHCRELKKQLESAMESGKLDHLLKDWRRRDAGRDRPNPRNNDRGRPKVINMIRTVGEKKRKSRGSEEEWMRASITFPPISSHDLSEEPLIV